MPNTTMIYAITPVLVAFETATPPDIASESDAKDDMMEEIMDCQSTAFKVLTYQFDVSDMEDGNYLFKFLYLLKAEGGVMTETDYTDYVDSFVDSVASAMERFLKETEVPVYRRVAVKTPTSMHNF